MGDIVEVADSPDVEVQNVENQNSNSSMSSSFEELRTLKREMDFRGSMLGKTWSELSRIMTKYQSQLVQKHEQFESSFSAGEHGRLNQLENVIEKKSSDVQRLEKNVADMERKLLEKDGEIVRLRTEVHKLRNEVSMKDSLIHKLQNQMAKEAMEYSAEINSLKEILEMESQNNSGALDVGAAKRRRLVQSPRNRLLTESQAKNETLQSCQVQGSQSDSNNGSHFSRPTPLKNHTQTLSDLHQGMDPGFSEEHSGEGQDPVESYAQSGDDSSYYKLDEIGEDDSNSADVMSDLLEQKPIINPMNSQVEPQMLIPNVHSSQAAPQYRIREARGKWSRKDPANLATKGRPLFPCPLCGKVFALKWMVKRHMKSHLGIKPFRCKLCGWYFTEKFNAESHVRNRHDVNKYGGNTTDFVLTVEIHKETIYDTSK